MKVFEIFKSISGEVAGCPQGSLATFIRFSKCNLNCKFCFGARPGRRKPRIITSIKNNKKIMDVKIGDKLMTFNNEMSLVETEVTDVMTREVDIWYRIKIEGTEYCMTPEHPFFTNNGLVEAKDLKIGDQILHSKYNDKISFTMLGDKNPMKQRSVVEKSKKNTDYKKAGLKISNTIKHKKELGIYTPTWDLLNNEQKNNVKKKISFANSGKKNGNYTGHNKNFYYLKKLVLNNEITKCNLCPSGSHLEVHHIDGDVENDDMDNLTVICKSCHTSIHKKGYNFWNKRKEELNENSRTKMKKRLKKVKRNGMEVQKIKMVNRSNFAPSIRPKPLKVYNFTCEPYNSYLVDYMWVHNCDAKETQDGKKGYELSVKGIIDKVKELGLNNIIITGGEPLLQLKNLVILTDELLKLEYNISIETNGTLFPEGLAEEVTIVMDYKLDQGDLMNREAFEHLTDNDIIKFVVKDLKDIEKAISIQNKLINENSWTGTKFAYSPMMPLMKNIMTDDTCIIKTQELAKMITDQLNKNGLEGIINIQIHKILDLA